MSNLCEKCGKNPWVAPVYLGTKPTESWCDDCIQDEIDTNGSVTVIGNYFELKKQREVRQLLDDFIETGDYSYPDSRLVKIKDMLLEMWGE